MVEDWLFSLAKAIGFFFIHPMFYVGLIVVFIMSYQRIKRERTFFGLKVFDIFSEMKSTIGFGLLTGLILSLLFIGLGIGLSYETIIVLNISVILFLLRGRFTLLSAAYTLGLVYFVLYFSPFLIKQFDLTLQFSPTNHELTAVGLIIGLLLMVEALFIRKTKNTETMPELELGSRGKWIGFHRLNKIGLIPFFIIVPNGLIMPFADYWPILPLGNEGYGLMLIPLFIGFDYTMLTNVPERRKKSLMQATFTLGFLVLALAISSIYISVLSLVAVGFAIIGKEWISYRHRMKERSNRPYFAKSNKGVMVLAILPQSPAERIGIQVGEIITRVNGVHVYTEADLYNALQSSGSFCKIEVIDLDQEQRFLQSALYEGDHHRIGIVTVTEPYRRGDTDLQQIS